MAGKRESTGMSSIVPRFLIRWIGGAVERCLPLKWWDALNQFRVESRLIFSRAIILLVGAMFAVFTWIALAENSIREGDVFGILHFQVFVLAILLNMNLWESEREGRTFELLIMRIPNLRRLIWFKMRVSLFWMTALAVPLFAGYKWFLSMRFSNMVLLFVFIVSFAVLVAFATCIVASFVHHGLTSGIVTFVLTIIVMSFSENRIIPYYDYFRPFVDPLRLQTEELTMGQTVWLMIVNRAVLGLMIVGLYRWLRNRLAKTEKWIQ